MEQLNKIELRGIVGSIRRQTFNDSSVANFTMVTNYAYKDRDGTPVIESTWHNVTAWEGRDIQNVEKIEKGSKIYVTGRLRNHQYTGSDGIDRTSTEVMAKRILLIDDEQQLQCEMI